ncbi:hypothetical protein [Mangrovibacterium sp.]|uniref:hypothetical protein n=1 Tax=Mangrovibacterium sp. TaxID=1961364 RepID=UPI0035618B90
MSKILSLTECAPDSFPCYFFDANVWIALLRYNQTDKKEKRFVPYIDLFEAIINLNTITDPKIVKRIKYQPQIAVTSMLVSEIINAYLRNVAMPAFFPNSKPGEKNFKRDYRQFKYSDYDKQLKLIVDDIQAYSFVYKLMCDKFDSLNSIDMLNSLTRDIDFNDLYYQQLMEVENVAIVTDDKDFSSCSVNVITANPKLLR